MDQTHDLIILSSLLYESKGKTKLYYKRKKVLIISTFHHHSTPSIPSLFIYLSHFFTVEMQFKFTKRMRLVHSKLVHHPLVPVHGAYLGVNW